jgi:ABC-2 type transport system permease protein
MSKEIMMSKKMFVILKREFFTRARSKSFIIGTLIFPLLLVLIFGGYYFFSKMSQPSTKSFYVVDKSDLVYEKLSRSLQDTLKTGAPRFEFIKYNNTENNFDRQIEKIRQDVINEKVYGYMIIPENIIEQRKIEYKASNVGDFEDQRIIRNTISDIIKSHRLENLGLDSDKIEEEISKSRVRLATSQITEEGEVEKSGGASFLLSYIMTYIMFLMIIIYGQITMRSVITEKNERITESIVSAVKPFSLMSGKILGICLLGLVQMLVFGLIISI